MPDGASLKFEGTAEFANLLKQLGAATAGKIGTQAVKAGAEVIADEARRLVHVRSGALRDSIAVKIEKKNRGADEVAAIVGFKSPQSSLAHLEEFGTMHQAAHPFLRPAVDAAAGEAIQEMSRVLGKGIEREARKLAKPVK